METDASDAKMKSVNYAGLSAYFIEAIKELKRTEEFKTGEIDVLRTENASLRMKMTEMDAKISELEKKLN